MKKDWRYWLALGYLRATRPLDDRFGIPAAQRVTKQRMWDAGFRLCSTLGCPEYVSPEARDGKCARHVSKRKCRVDGTAWAVAGTDLCKHHGGSHVQAKKS